MWRVAQSHAEAVAIALQGRGGGDGAEWLAQGRRGQPSGAIGEHSPEAPASLPLALEKKADRGGERRLPKVMGFPLPGEDV